MKKYIIIGLFFITNALIAQEKIGGNIINLSAYIPEQAEEIPYIARSLFINKLGQIITSNGVSNNINNSRFILVPNATVLSKDITATAPPKVALNIEVTLYIGDGYAGNLFNSETFQLKGVGINETKAFMSALKGLNPNNPKIQQFIDKSKNKIVSYFDENCSKIQKEIDVLESQNKFGEALSLLSSIPIKSSCFNKVEDKFKTLYKKTIDIDCERKLVLATALWAANQDIETANKAGELLASIEPNAACFNKVTDLYNKIGNRVKDLSDRGWTVYLKQVEIEKDQIQAARDIGVAFGNNQPKNPVYNIRGWF